MRLELSKYNYDSYSYLNDDARQRLCSKAADEFVLEILLQRGDLRLRQTDIRNLQNNLTRFLAFCWHGLIDLLAAILG